MYQLHVLGGSRIVESFEAIPETQKQDLATKLVQNEVHVCDTYNVNWILNKSFEDSDAPLCYDDITNNEHYGDVEINGQWEQLTESERNEKLEFYEYLRDKTQTVCDTVQDKLFYLYDEAFNTSDSRLSAFKVSTLDRFVDICDKLESMNFDEQKEIYEWWICSSWLINELEGRGECTLDGRYWGRRTTGQAICLDYSIQKLAFDVFAWKLTKRSIGK